MFHSVNITKAAPMNEDDEEHIPWDCKLLLFVQLFLWRRRVHWE